MKPLNCIFGGRVHGTRCDQGKVDIAKKKVEIFWLQDRVAELQSHVFQAEEFSGQREKKPIQPHEIALAGDFVGRSSEQ